MAHAAARVLLLGASSPLVSAIKFWSTGAGGNCYKGQYSPVVDKCQSCGVSVKAKNGEACVAYDREPAACGTYGKEYSWCWTSNTWQYCDAACPVCERICTYSKCNQRGYAKYCPIGFSLTGVNKNKDCAAGKSSYECCRYKEDKASCDLNKGNPATNLKFVKREISKWVWDDVGFSCARKNKSSVVAVQVAMVGVEVALTLAAAARRMLALAAQWYQPYVGLQRQIEVRKRVDTTGGMTYFYIQATNNHPGSAIKYLGFQYLNKNGVALCKRKFLPHWYESAFYADEKVSCGDSDEEVKVWGYNIVSKAKGRTGPQIAWLFMGPFNTAALDRSQVGGNGGITFAADFVKKAGNGQLYVYQWENYSKENQRCNGEASDEKTKEGVPCIETGTYPAACDYHGGTEYPWCWTGSFEWSWGKCQEASPTGSSTDGDVALALGKDNTSNGDEPTDEDEVLCKLLKHRCGEDVIHKKCLRTCAKASTKGSSTDEASTKGSSTGSSTDGNSAMSYGISAVALLMALCF